jgi:hypothetical protein
MVERAIIMSGADPAVEELHERAGEMGCRGATCSTPQSPGGSHVVSRSGLPDALKRPTFPITSSL